MTGPTAVIAWNRLADVGEWLASPDLSLTAGERSALNRIAGDISDFAEREETAFQPMFVVPESSFRSAMESFPPKAGSFGRSGEQPVDPELLLRLLLFWGDWNMTRGLTDVGNSVHEQALQLLEDFSPDQLSQDPAEERIRLRSAASAESGQ